MYAGGRQAADDRKRHSHTSLEKAREGVGGDGKGNDSNSIIVLLTRLYLSSLYAVDMPMGQRKEYTLSTPLSSLR